MDILDPEMNMVDDADFDEDDAVYEELQGERGRQTPATPTSAQKERTPPSTQTQTTTTDPFVLEYVNIIILSWFSC